MRLEKFTISNMRYETVKLYFQFDNSSLIEFEIECHFNCLKHLLKALVDIHEKDIATANFELTESGFIDLIFIDYPGGTVRVEFYEDVVWDNVDDLYSVQQPVPLISYFTNWHDLTFAITSEYERHTEEEFLLVGHPKPNEELKKLRDFMVGKK